MLTNLMNHIVSSTTHKLERYENHIQRKQAALAKRQRKVVPRATFEQLKQSKFAL